jgi:hypothetical protein
MRDHFMNAQKPLFRFGNSPHEKSGVRILLVRITLIEVRDTKKYLGIRLR